MQFPAWFYRDILKGHRAPCLRVSIVPFRWPAKLLFLNWHLSRCLYRLRISNWIEQIHSNQVRESRKGKDIFSLSPVITDKATKLILLSQTLPRANRLNSTYSICAYRSNYLAALQLNMYQLTAYAYQKYICRATLYNCLKLFDLINP